MGLRSRIFLFVIFLAPLTACISPQVREPAAIHYSNTAWESYASSYSLSRLQKGCEPRIVQPPSGVTPIAKMIAIHGYTACPQQYFEWAEKLARRGIVVQLMLMPGHGLQPTKPGVDNIDQMPSDGNPNAYYQFVNQITQIARGDRLPTMISGISVGGAVALQAAAQDPEAFEKVILFSPYFAASSRFYRNFLPLGGHTPLLRSKIISWGPTCLNEMSRGRVGTCSFRIHQLQAAQKFGERIAKKVVPLHPIIQIVGVTGDKAASSASMREAAQNLGWSLQNQHQVSICLYKGGANHSLLSKYDSPDENKFWFSQMVEDATQFVTKGTFFPVQGDSGEQGLPACRIN